MDRLERLVNLVAALRHTERPLTRDEIFDRVPGYDGTEEAVRRAFERDKESLRAIGVTLAAEKVDPTNADSPEGYRIRRDEYELPDPGLAPDELAALHLAMATVRVGGGGPVEEALWKLGGRPADDVAAGDGGAAAATSAGAGAAIPGGEHLPVLFQAVTERRTARIEHRGTARTVDPWQLAFRSGHWYLVGWDHDRSAQRSFRLDRLTGEPRLGPPGAFERPPEATTGHAKPWEMGEGDPVDVDVLVDADQAPEAVALTGEAAVADRRSDGAVVVRLRVTNRPALRSFVLSFLDHAEVVAPEEVRDEVVSWVEAIAASTPVAGSAGERA